MMRTTTGKDAMVDQSDSALAGQAIYTRPMLHSYDMLVYRLNFPILWRCPAKRLLHLYEKHVSARHLDIGVATGYLIDRCRFPVERPELTLMDLNPNSLEFAARRLGRYAPRTHRANLLTPWELPEESFDSIAMCNLLHCVPGTMREKGIGFKYARRALAPRGRVFGATILGERACHTPLSWLAVRKLNQKRVFCNLADRVDELDEALTGAFESHEVEIHGAVALFTAQTGAGVDG